MNRLFFMIAGFIGLRKLTGKDRKSAGEWGFLLSMLFIVPLLLGMIEKEVIKIVLQLFWAGFLTRSAFLANDTWKKNKQQR